MDERDARVFLNLVSVDSAGDYRVQNQQIWEVSEFVIRYGVKANRDVAREGLFAAHVPV